MKNVVKKEILKQFRRITALTVMGCVLFVSIFTVGALSKEIVIYDGEETVSVSTVNTDTNKIIEQAGLKLDPEDLLFRVDNPDGSTEIVVKRAFMVNVTADDKTVSLKFVMGSVEDAIINSGLSIGENDHVSPDLHTGLEPNMNILIERRNKIFVNADGRVKDYTVPVGLNFGEALKFAEVPLYESDIISEDLSAPVTNGAEVTIKRVGNRNSITTEKIAYKTIRKNVDYLDEGVTKVSVKGVNGEREVVVKETIINGEVVKSEEIQNKVTVKPVNEVILVGTKKKNQTVQVFSGSSKASSSNNTKVGNLTDSKGTNLTYTKVLTGSGTAYTAGPGARTSTGTQPKHGTVAVNPSIIPYGTKMYIVAEDGSFVYGYATAEDTGGALRQGTALVDLYMDSTQACINFGRRNVKVYILN